MINPYFIYILAFSGVSIAYLFGWSSLFPTIKLPLIIFLVLSMVGAFILGLILKKKKIIVFQKLEYNANMTLITLGILFGYLLEGFYNKGFPLLSMLLKMDSNYTEFGIPMFHVFLVTFNSFFALYLFQVLLSISNKKLIGFLFVLNLVPSLLIVNRGMLVIIMMGCLSIFLIKYQKEITVKLMLFIISFLVIVAFLFGVSGNMRVNNSYQTGKPFYDNDKFLSIGGATSDFKNSPIPKEFFWTYIYGASPLANLQHTIDKVEFDEDIDGKSTSMFIVTQLLPDFISKRIVGIYGYEVPEHFQITPELNVGTGFILAYVILGWPGIVLFTIVLFGFAFFYIVLLKNLNSRFFIVGIAILNSLFLMNTFANMISFTGLSLQLIYPIFFSILDNTLEKNNKKRFLI